MTEYQEPNPFAQFFDSMQMQAIGPILVDENDDGTIFSDAIEAEFEVAMSALADQMPEGDEDAANALMAQMVQSMMVNCFRAGMLFQNAIEPPVPDEVTPVLINEQTAFEIVRGLVGNGVRLVVDRGQD